MSTALLYHGFGIVGYRHVGTRYEEGKVVFAIRQEPNRMKCSRCGGTNLIRRGTCVRRFRALPIGRKAVWIDLPVQRVQCLTCKAVQQVDVEFAARRRSYTKSFERYAVQLCRLTTIQDAAWHLGVSWDVVKDIDKRYLGRRFGRPRLGRLKLIAIDELCIGKGRYLTLVLNLKSGEVVFVGQGKGKDALLPFWKRLARHKAAIRAVAIDMSVAYLSAVWEHLPGAAVVFDRFHVIKLYNEKLTQLRRQVQNSAEALGKKVLKGTRWLLLKNIENLDPRKKEPQRLAEALMLNQPLGTAYYLKE